jgi:membrane protein
LPLNSFISVLKIERIIVSSLPVRFVTQHSKHWILPGFERVPLYDVIQFFRQELKIYGIRERASAIAFNFIMSIPPTCLFLFTLIPNLPFVSKRAIKNQLHDLIRDIVQPKVYNTGLIKFVDSFIDGNKIGLISVGFLASLFFASNAMIGVMNSFNKNYIGFEKRKGLHDRWVAIKLTSLLFSLVLVCLFLLITQSSVLSWMGIQNSTIKNIILNGKWVIITGLIYFSFAFIYKYAPSTHKRWRLSSPGAIIATTLSILAIYGVSFFVTNFTRYNVLFGSIGTIMVIMILIYVNSLVILIGFEFNRSIKTLRSIAEEREAREKLLKG